MRFKVLTTFGLLVTASLGVPNSALAQAELLEGVKVRVSSGGAPVTGVVSAISQDSLVLLAEGGGKLSIARSSIQKLQISEGRKASAGAKKGAIWGAAIFGGFGVLIAALIENDASWEDTYGDPNPWGFAALMTVEGAGIGAIIGGFVKSEKWHNVTVQPGIGFGSNGLRLGLSIR